MLTSMTGLGGKDVYGNVTPGFTYGESMGGGTGAGPTWHGKHATHVVSVTTGHICVADYNLALHQHAAHGCRSSGAQNPDTLATSSNQTGQRGPWYVQWWRWHGA